MRHIKNFIIVLTCLAAALPVLTFRTPSAQAAASLFVNSQTGKKTGETVTITVYVNTGGQSANAFEANISYPTSLLQGVRGTFSGSVCSLPVTQPDPSGGTATFSCGTPSGYNGTGLVATLVFTAIGAGTGTIGLSNCQVLANDGLGTDITGGCSGAGITIADGSAPADTDPTPTPTPQATPTPTPTSVPKNTPKPTNTPTPPPSKPTQQPKNSENPQNNANPAATPTPGVPATQVLPPSTPTPTPSATPTPTPEEENSEKRSIATAFKDLLTSFNEFRSTNKDFTGLIALFFTLIPFLAIVLAIMFLGYRLYLLERRRKRTLDRLFELELSELSALEGKMDLLAEKGAKGREQYREEFKHAKENILRQLRPDFGKPVESAKKEAQPKPEDQSKPAA